MKAMNPGSDIKIPWNSFAEYLSFMDKQNIAINLACLVGFTNVRTLAGPGYEKRPPSDTELANMKKVTRDSILAGAFGISTGLIYSPQSLALTQEIIEVCKAIADLSCFYTSHIRDEALKVVSAVKEAIEITAKSGINNGHISHHKISARPIWGASKETLLLLEQANQKGIDMTCDVYPYEKSQTMLSAGLPPWVHAGGQVKLMENLRDPLIQTKIKQEMLSEETDFENFIPISGFDNIYVAGFGYDGWKQYTNLSLAEIARKRGDNKGWETFFTMLVENEAAVFITDHGIGEEDIKRIMKHPLSMIGSDGMVLSPEGDSPFSKMQHHPRCYGAFTRVLGKYARETPVLSLSEAIRKMTGFPAQKLGLSDRGYLMEGMWADIVIFDADIVEDTATFVNPHQFSKGIDHVLVNGKPVIKDGQFTSELPGQILKNR